MKQTAILVLACLLVPAAVDGQGSLLTLSSVVRRVAAKNPGILAQKAAVEAARADAREVRTERLPKIYLSMDTGEGKNVNDIANVLLTGLSGASVADPGTRTRLADLSLSRPYFVPGARLEDDLYDGGRTRAAIGAALAKQDETSVGEQKAAEEKAYLAATDYLNLARAQILEKDLGDYAEIATRFAQALADQAKAGRITEAQALGSQTKALDAKTSLDNNRDDMCLWSDLLRQLAALPASAAFDTQKLEAYLSGFEPAVIPEQADLASNLDVQDAGLEAEIEKQHLHEALSRKLPQIKIVAQYGYQFSNLLFTFRPGYNAGIEVTYPLFTSGATERAIAAEQARLRAATLKQRETREVLSGQYAEVRELEAAKAELDQAREVYRVASLKYDQGAGSDSDLLEAAGLLLTSRERCLDLTRSSLLLYWRVLETQGRLEASLEKGALP
jgi:outer membrane protein TolC